MNLREAYEASEMVCCDLQQVLVQSTDVEEIANTMDTLSNAEIVRNYLLAEIDFQ